MVAQQLLDRRAIEQPGIVYGLGVHGVFEYRQQRPAEPLVCGDIQTGLLPLQYRRRQLIPHQTLQDDLLPRSIDLQPLGQTRREFHNPVIEQRRPHFERMRHAHTIHLAEQIVLQVVVLIEQQITVQKTDLAR